jgi:L-serine dehydratase
MLSVLDIFRVGIGPSSSHTVGPMRITERFIRRLKRLELLEETARIEVSLRGSLAFTGVGHGSLRAALLGLAGLKPESFDPKKADNICRKAEEGRLSLGGEVVVSFNMKTDILLDYETPADLHPNEMAVFAYNAQEKEIAKRTYYSTGGGFIASRAQLLKPAKNDIVTMGESAGPYQFKSAADLLAFCKRDGLPIHQVILANEDSKRLRNETEAKLDNIAEKMMNCIDRGLKTHGILPGGLKVSRRAPKLWDKLKWSPQSNEREQLFDWLNVYAMAVNEENAAGGQVVTAPTNGAAGIIPSVIRHYCLDKGEEAVRIFLLTAGGIGLLYKQRASISGAEMGCQGEVGVACSMAAGGLAAVWGGTPDQVCSAAEIGMEHNLGLTCDPVGGLVQIPCIERNAIGAVKAVNAARLALHSSEAAKVSLDQVIETMRQTGLDMSTKYKETSQGGLAVNVVEC